MRAPRNAQNGQGRRRHAKRLLLALTLVTFLEHSASSARAEPNACIAAADQGQQLRDEGKYRDARAAFVTCAREACPIVIAKSCMQWLREIDVGMPTIVVAARDEHGSDLANSRLFIDGKVAPERLDGLPLAIDPGEHMLRAERDGSLPGEARVVVRVGEKGRSVLITLRPKGTSVPSALPVAVVPSVPEASSPAAEGQTSESRGTFFTAKNVTVLSLAAAGVVSAVGAIYFGAQSRDEANVAAGYRASNGRSACLASSSAMCVAWSDAVDAQNRDATINRALFVAAGAFSVAALGTWLLAPSAANAGSSRGAAIAPKIAPTYAGLDLAGAF